MGEVFLRQVTGRTIKLQVRANERLEVALMGAYEKRDKKLTNVLFEDYWRAIKWIYGEKELFFDKTWKEQEFTFTKIINISERRREWTICYSFNKITFTAICPITLSKITNPWLLNPGCYHLFEREKLLAWMKHGNDHCPVCYHKIVAY